MRSLSVVVCGILLVCAFSFFSALLDQIRTTPDEILPPTSMLPLSKTVPDGSSSVSVRAEFPGLKEFGDTVLNGNPNEVVGVYAVDHFALPVDQQPDKQPSFVSTDDNLLTQFLIPLQYDVIGLLAHNYLSGRLFFDLEKGDQVIVIYGDGHTDFYQVTHSDKFQALNPASPYSDFVDLSDSSGRKITSANLFNKIYTAPDRLVFQTCIDAEGDPSWGRIFITAVKDTSIVIRLPSTPAISNN
jgi:hypothetical protein